jgi:hypothetical protein
MNDLEELTIYYTLECLVITGIALYREMRKERKKGRHRH